MTPRHSEPPKAEDVLKLADTLDTKGKEARCVKGLHDYADWLLAAATHLRAYAASLTVETPQENEIVRLTEEDGRIVVPHPAGISRMAGHVDPAPQDPEAESAAGKAAQRGVGQLCNQSPETPDQWKALETLCEAEHLSQGSYGWAVATMREINRLTPDVTDRPFSPDWFQLRQRFEHAEAVIRAVPELLRALKGISEENKELRQRDRVLSRQIERRACGRDEGSYALLRENAELAVHRDSLTAEVERLREEKTASDAEIAALRKLARVGTELDNHHAASFCPYCNPDRIMFPRDHEIAKVISETKTILAEKDEELATLKGKVKELWSLGKQATNAWACYANSEIQHKGIDILHRKLDAIALDLALHGSPETPKEQPTAPAPREEAK